MDNLPFLLQNLPASRRSLRVAVVTETYPPEINGVAMTVERTVQALRQRGHQIQLVRPRQRPDEAAADQPSFEEALQRGVPIPRYAGLKLGLPAKSALMRLWRERRPDVVHIATEGPLGWSALSAATRLRLPAATDFHTNFHTYTRHYGLGWLRAPIGAYLRKFHNKALCTLVPTEELRQDLQGAGYRNLLVVARGVDTALFHPCRRSSELRRQWGVADGDLVVLYVGRLAAEKNLSLVGEAYRRMREANPRARLVFVGDGPEREALQARFPEAIYAGMRTGEDLARHYASADVFLFSSATETFGNVTLEAMASGLAVVAYDYAAARDHLRHGENGLLAPLDDAREFVRQAERLAVSPVDVARFGLAGRDTAERADWEDVHDRFENILLGIVQEEERRHDTKAQLSFVPD
jgi:glycosyltransferase involved in cell wall biosynthesis